MSDFVQKVPGGHQFAVDEDGAIDVWRLEYEHHNGPECLACDATFCEHCNPEVYTEPCPALAEVPDAP